jgi:lysozyme
MSRARQIGLTLSAVGLVGIALFEGYRGTAYNDGVGVQTIGYGTTIGVQVGDKITPDRALVRLADDAAATERRLRECIGAVPLAQGEWDAYVSWAYNVGTGAACGSTLVAKLRRVPPDYEGACAELLRWTRAGGRELPGLVKRRQAEYQQCMEK